MNLVRQVALWTFLLIIPSISWGAGLEERVREHTLKNGLKLLMVERHASPTVAAWIRFRVGSVDERSDERGIAHLLEHVLFKGTKTLGTKDYAAEKPFLDRIEVKAQALMLEKSKREKGDPHKISLLAQDIASLEKEADAYVIKDEVAQIYTRHGAAGYNAFTSRDGTAYLINLPSNKVELWAAIESDRFKNAVLREFYTERSVVMEERRRSYEADPGRRLWETFLATAFPVHPAGQPTIGWMSDIENLSRSKAEAFLHKYYTPNNAVMAIVGDIEPARVIALVEKYFGDIPPGTTVPPVSAEEPPQFGEKRVEIVGDAEPSLLIGYHKPTLPSEDDTIFDVIEQILADGRTSRLYKRLVLEKQLVTGISAFSTPGRRYANLFTLSAPPRAPHTVQEVEDAIYTELERLKLEPVTERDLTQVLNNLEYEEARRLASNGGLARSLTEYEAVAGSWRYLVEHRRNIAGVKPADIMRVAQKYLVKKNRIVGFVTKDPVSPVSPQRGAPR